MPPPPGQKRRHRQRPPPLNLHEDVLAADLGQVPQQHHQFAEVTPPARAASAPGVRPPSPESDDSMPTDIRFRTAETPTKSLYSSGSPETMHSIMSGRRGSLVKAEDYMPPPSAGRLSTEMPFNPYQSPSWAAKPQGFELDLASPHTSPRPPAQASAVAPSVMYSVADKSTEHLAPVPAPAPASGNVEYDTLNSKRMLGGKQLVKSGEWRKKLHLDPNRQVDKPEVTSPHIIVEKEGSPDEKSLGSVDVHIGKLPEPTTVALPTQKRGFFKLVGTFMIPLIAVLMHIAHLVYLVLRAVYIVQAERATKSAFTSAWLFWVVELLYSLRLGAHSVQSYLTYRGQNEKKLRLKGDAFLPTVDVLIICTGQHDQIVMDTAMAASRLDWPIDRIRILVIDETGSHELQRRVESYASHRALHLSYHRKAKHARFPDAGSSRAALINFGLTETKTQGRLAGEFTLVLEADCLPKADILRALLPHMLQNSRLGLVRSDQGYYNIPLKVTASFGTFLSYTEPRSENRSGFVLRRCAVDDIGGFPVESSVEDGQLAAFLVGKGYSTKFCHEVLQYGLVPASWPIAMKQHLARATAPLRTARICRLFVGGPRLAHMSIWQRLSFLGLSLSPLVRMDGVIAIVLYAAALLKDDYLVPVMSMTELYILIRALFAFMLLQRLNDVLFYGETTTFMLQQRWAFGSAYQLVALGKAAVPRFLAKGKASTWENEAGARERDAKERKPLGPRIASIVLTPAGILHIALVLLVLAGIGYSAGMAAIHTMHRGGRQTFLLLLMTVCWPTLYFIPAIAGCLTAISYALSPPSIPPRDHLLLREPITGLAKPSLEIVRRRPFAHRHDYEIMATYLSSCYITALFVLSFFHVLDI